MPESGPSISVSRSAATTESFCTIEESLWFRKDQSSIQSQALATLARDSSLGLMNMRITYKDTYVETLKLKAIGNWNASALSLITSLNSWNYLFSMCSDDPALL
jgi:hypothetical protein